MRLLLLMILFPAIVIAQNTQEWTQQKKTQIKYLLEQIIASKVYIDYAKKGYDVARKGLNTIRDIKGGDFSLHKVFIDSRLVVNPKIRSASKVAAIMALQVKIVKESGSGLNRIRQGGRFTDAELAHCVKVFENLLNGCLDILDELFMVVTSGQTSMTDDERLKRIDKLHDDIQSSYGFCSSFGGEMDFLSVQRLGEQIELERSRKINGIQ